MHINSVGGHFYGLDMPASAKFCAKIVSIAPKEKCDKVSFHPSEDGCGIDSNYNKVSILSSDNNSYEISKNRKDRVAKKILEFVINRQD